MLVTTGLPVVENTVSPARACLRKTKGVFGCTFGVITPIRSALAAFIRGFKGVLYFELKNDVN